jgi:hypothetical protein
MVETQQLLTTTSGKFATERGRRVGLGGGCMIGRVWLSVEMLYLFLLKREGIAMVGEAARFLPEWIFDHQRKRE